MAAGFYNPSEIEKKILALWESEKTFKKRAEKNKGHKKFSFIDGPITANNPMGVHHARGRTYKDLFQRFKAMQGFDQRYQNGFDCQGLHVEVGIEKTLGLNSKIGIEEYGIDKFAKAARASVMKFAKKQTEESIKLGQWMDWDNSYYTMSDENIDGHLGFPQEMPRKGMALQGPQDTSLVPALRNERVEARDER